MEEVLESSVAVATVEGAIETFCNKEGIETYTYWSWGYEFAMPERHRWDAGVLCGYWCAMEDEYQGLKPKFERLRQHLETLDIISRIDADSYRYPSDDDFCAGDQGLGDPDNPLLGETWTIEFRPKIFYDHK